MQPKSEMAVELDLNKLSDRLRQVRQITGLSQSELARIAGKKQYLSWLNYEQGRTHPTPKSLQAIATHLNINLSWLADGSGKMWLDGAPSTSLPASEVAPAVAQNARMAMPLGGPYVSVRLAHNALAELGAGRGRTLLADPQQTPQEGDLVLASHSGNPLQPAILKHRDAREATLQFFNNKGMAQVEQLPLAKLNTLAPVLFIKLRD